MAAVLAAAAAVRPLNDRFGFGPTMLWALGGTGVAWLVIVAAEMLTGTPGVGGFLWQEYNSLIYAHILLAIVTIGVVGFALDRLMGLAEQKLR